jgi:transposase
MMTQGEFVDVIKLRDAGWTVDEIAAEVGYHPATVRGWLKAGGPPARREVTVEERVIDPGWQARIHAMLKLNPRLLATSIHDRLVAEGFEGSYPTVARFVREVRGPRFKTGPESTVPIETAPGAEAQADWSDCTEWAARWGWGHDLWCWGCILCWSRWRTLWFATSVDRQHTFEGMVRFFEGAGGVPQAVRIDRMGALGRSEGKRFVLHPPTVGFAAHHQVEVVACLPGDAQRKGKIERPFRDVKASFLEEIELDGPPSSVDELNERAGVWLERRVHQVRHRSTGVAPAERLEIERRLLKPLAPARFVTDYVDARKVHRNIPWIEYHGVKYSVPADLIGQTVEIRRPVASDEFTIRWAGSIVAAHHIAADGVSEVWDPEHRRGAERSALLRRRKHLTVVPDPIIDATTDPAAGRGLVLDGDYAVDPPDLDRYGVETGASQVTAPSNFASESLSTDRSEEGEPA